MNTIVCGQEGAVRAYGRVYLRVRYVVLARGFSAERARQWSAKRSD